MPLAPDLANTVMDTLLGSVFLSLHSSDPGQDGSGEISGGSYRRQPIRLANASNGIRRNSAVVAFPLMPPTAVVYVGLWTEQEGGELLWTAKLETPKQPGPNDTVFFDPGDLEFGLRTE